MEETIREFVEASVNYDSALQHFKEALCEFLKISISSIKETYVSSVPQGNSKVLQIVTVKLIGTNVIKSEDIKDIKGLAIITPNILEFTVGEFPL